MLLCFHSDVHSGMLWGETTVVTRIGEDSEARAPCSPLPSEARREMFLSTSGPGRVVPLSARYWLLSNRFRFTLGTHSITCPAPCPSAPAAGDLRLAPVTQLCQCSWAWLCELWANFTSPALAFSFLPFLFDPILVFFFSQVGFWAAQF